MNILVVEDDPANLALIRERMMQLDNELQITDAVDRDSAIRALHNLEYDLIVLDLRIPGGAADPELDERNGIQVAREIEEQRIMSLLYVVSGAATRKAIAKVLRPGTQHQIFGDRRDHPVIEFFDKDDFEPLFTRIGECIQGFEQLERIQIDKGGRIFDIEPMDQRILRNFTRRHDCSRVLVRPIPGGLSGSRVMAVATYNEAGNKEVGAIAKIGLINDIADEVDRYDTFIAPTIGIGRLSHKICHIEAGAGRRAGVFYAIADGYDENIFDVLRHRPQDAGQVVQNLRRIEANWQEAGAPRIMSVGELRERETSLEKIDPSNLAEFGIEELEKKRITIRRCIQHGDLHGANVLVKGNDPILIDYGEAGRGNAALDPMKLELSLLFHPDRPASLESWVNQEIVTDWADLDAFTRDCPVGDFIRECREWSFAAAAGVGDQSVYVAAYCTAMRQLRYPDTDKAIARALIRAVARFI